MYCDGSVSNGRVGCGIVIREYFEEVTIDEHLSMRVGDNLSSTGAELYAIYLGLRESYQKFKDTYFCGQSKCIEIVKQ